jgi:hypothetical protein
MKNDGITTITEVKEFLEEHYDKANIWNKIQMKAWSYHSVSRTINNNPPFTFNNYTHHMNEKYYIEQINLGMIECDDIGGKESAIKFLEDRMK